MIKVLNFSAWWHLVAPLILQPTSGDRLRVYINGERQTNFSTETYPSQNQSYSQLVSGNFELGKYGSTDRPTYLAHVIIVMDMLTMQTVLDQLMQQQENGKSILHQMFNTELMSI